MIIAAFGWWWVPGWGPLAAPSPGGVPDAGRQIKAEKRALTRRPSPGSASARRRDEGTPTSARAMRQERSHLSGLENEISGT